MSKLLNAQHLPTPSECVEESVCVGVVGLSHVASKSCYGREKRKKIERLAGGRVVEIKRAAHFRSEHRPDIVLGLVPQERVPDHSRCMNDSVQRSEALFAKFNAIHNIVLFRDIALHVQDLRTGLLPIADPSCRRLV